MRLSGGGEERCGLLQCQHPHCRRDSVPAASRRGRKGVAGASSVRGGHDLVRRRIRLFSARGAGTALSGRDLRSKRPEAHDCAAGRMARPWASSILGREWRRRSTRSQNRGGRVSVKTGVESAPGRGVADSTLGPATRAPQRVCELAHLTLSPNRQRTRLQLRRAVHTWLHKRRRWAQLQIQNFTEAPANPGPCKSARTRPHNELADLKENGQQEEREEEEEAERRREPTAG
mmetsp:Transcript_30799/g.77928  ORF Transcript_30799/g.77928 Transcript_30799/m.77928 type:complete len:232 (-) Transcript_30799:3378-4073(-)